MNDLGEDVQDKYREKWTCMYLMDRHFLSNRTISRIKYASRLNMCRDRIKIIDKRNFHAECLMGNQDESWERVIL